MAGEATPETFTARFDGAERSTKFESVEGVVTVDPNIPLRLGSTSLKELGGAPNAMLGCLLGDQIETTLRRVNYFRYQYGEMWPQVQRLYEYYLEEDWKYFDALEQQIYGHSGSRQAERDSISFRSVTPLLAGCETSRMSVLKLMTEFDKHLPALINENRLLEYATQTVDSGVIARDQRRIWDSFKLLVDLHEMWLPGLLAEASIGNSTVDINEFRLCRNDFASIRDAYVNGFETFCKSLVHVMAVINASLRGSPESLRATLPTAIRERRNARPPRTFSQYQKLVNADKLAYLEEWPEWGTELPILVSNKLRNSIGHNSVRHNLRNGRIENDNGESINYLEFVRLVYCLVCAIPRILHVVHTIKVIASVGRYSPPQ
jgi:hypothetical protein